MHQAFRPQARTNAGLIQKCRRGLFNHAGANAAQHVIRAALFQNDRVNAGLMQQLPKQQPSRTGADNRNLGTRWKTHGLPLKPALGHVVIPLDAPCG
jgi:hypothetical protein